MVKVIAVPDLKVHKVSQDQWDYKAYKALLDKLAHKDPRDLKDHKAPKGYPAIASIVPAILRENLSLQKFIARFRNYCLRLPGLTSPVKLLSLKTPFTHR